MSVSTSRVNGHSVTDADLEDVVRTAIQRYGTLRIWGHAMSVEVTDGIVTLSGHVRTRVSKTTVEDLVSKVEGVRGVKNELFVDTDLEIAVAQALAQDSRTVKGFPGILVGSGFGEIFLKGAVASQ